MQGGSRTLVRKPDRSRRKGGCRAYHSVPASRAGPELGTARGQGCQAAPRPSPLAPPPSSCPRHHLDPLIGDTL